MGGECTLPFFIAGAFRGLCIGCITYLFRYYSLIMAGDDEGNFRARRRASTMSLNAGGGHRTSVLVVLPSGASTGRLWLHPFPAFHMNSYREYKQPFVCRDLNPCPMGLSVWSTSILVTAAGCMALGLSLQVHFCKIHPTKIGPAWFLHD